MPSLTISPPSSNLINLKQMIMVQGTAFASLRAYSYGGIGKGCRVRSLIPYPNLHDLAGLGAAVLCSGSFAKSVVRLE